MSDNIPSDGDNSSSKIYFKNPVPSHLGDRLMVIIHHNLVTDLHWEEGDFMINPIFNEQKELIALDFNKILNSIQETQIKTRLRNYLEIITEEHRSMKKMDRTTAPRASIDSLRPKKPISFTDFLGTYHIKVTRIIIPIMITIFTATFLAWVSRIVFGIDVNASIVDPEESSVWGILLNGLVPVLMSAVFITVIWLLIKKFGINVFRILMGGIVLFYIWFGIVYYIPLFYIIGWELIAPGQLTQGSYNLFYYALAVITAIALILIGIQFLREKLNLTAKNTLVLLFGIFMGAVMGSSFPPWTTFSFALFLSAWDLITVFRGPLGKIANIIRENREEYGEIIMQKIQSGEISQEQADALGLNAGLRDGKLTNEEIKHVLRDLEIELGSGDLIMYSALVANTFTSLITIPEISMITVWIVSGMVIAGVLAGAVLTIYLLLKKNRVLPALPFSVLFGFIMYLIGMISFGLF